MVEEQNCSGMLLLARSLSLSCLLSSYFIVMLDSHALAPGETQIAVVTYAALHRVLVRINSHASLCQIEINYVSIFLQLDFSFSFL